MAFRWPWQKKKAKLKDNAYDRGYQEGTASGYKRGWNEALLRATKVLKEVHIGAELKVQNLSKF